MGILGKIERMVGSRKRSLQVAQEGVDRTKFLQLHAGSTAVRSSGTVEGISNRSNTNSDTPIKSTSLESRSVEKIQQETKICPVHLLIMVAADQAKQAAVSQGLHLLARSMLKYPQWLQAGTVEPDYSYLHPLRNLGLLDSWTPHDHT